MPSCSLPSDDLPSGKFVAGTASRSDGLLPKWVNLTLARQGQQFAQNFKANLGLSHIYGLISGLGKSDLVNLLTFTQKSHTVDKAIMRYTSTITQVLLWYDNILKVDDKDSVVFTSLSNVRRLHKGAAKRAAAQISANGTLFDPNICINTPTDDTLWADFEKDLEESNIPLKARSFPTAYTSREGESLPVNQFAHSLTQFAFVGFPILYPERLFISASDEDLFAFNHLWAVLGYALGIDDKYNIALQPDIKQLRDYYQRIMDDYWLPGLFGVNNDRCSRHLDDILLATFAKMLPILSPRVLLITFLRDILKIEVPNMKANLSYMDRLKDTALSLQSYPIVQNRFTRAIANTILSNYMKWLGTQYYGSHHSTEQSKAEKVFFSM